MMQKCCIVTLYLKKAHVLMIKLSNGLESFVQFKSDQNTHDADYAHIEETWKMSSSQNESIQSTPITLYKEAEKSIRSN